MKAVLTASALFIGFGALTAALAMLVHTLTRGQDGYTFPAVAMSVLCGITLGASVVAPLLALSSAHGAREARVPIPLALKRLAPVPKSEGECRHCGLERSEHDHIDDRDMCPDGDTRFEAWPVQAR